MAEKVVLKGQKYKSGPKYLLLISNQYEKEKEILVVPKFLMLFFSHMTVLNKIVQNTGME